MFGAFALFPVMFWARALPPGMDAWSALYGAGQLSALVGFVLIFFQYVLSSRVRWIERGIGLDRLFHRHRAVGVAGLALAAAHPAALTAFDLSRGGGLSMHPLKVLGAAAFVHRIARWISVRRSPHAVTGVVRETHDTWSVFFERKNVS